MKLTKNQKDDFLTHLSETANATESAKLAGIKVIDLYRARREDEDFRSLWDEAFEVGQYVCEDAARKRAFAGYRKPVYQGGVEVGEIHCYSDSLAKFILEADKPEKYRRSKDAIASGIEALARAMSDKELNETIERNLKRLGVDDETIQENKL